MKPHQEQHADGTPQGRDPRRMSVEDLQACGLERQSRGDAIRAKCLDCCSGAPSEVRRCGDIACPLWPFRMGTDPWRERREMTDEQRQEIAERFRAARSVSTRADAEERR